MRCLPRLFLDTACRGGSHLQLSIVAALRPLMKPQIGKKRTKKCIWHQSDQYVKIKCDWWKPRRIDNRVCRRVNAQNSMPNIAYGGNKKTEHMQWLPEVPGPDVKELEVLLMCNTPSCAEIARISSGNAQPLCREKPSRALGSPLPAPGCAAKTVNRQIM